MSLAPKVDEVREVVQQENYDLVCLVETWLQDHIDDNVVHVPGYNLIRRDRSERIHGGVCIYVKDTIQFSRLDELSDDSFEVLWISLRSVRLPREITNLVVATVYHAPRANDTDMLNYLFNSLSLMKSRFPCCGFYTSRRL